MHGLCALLLSRDEERVLRGCDVHLSGLFRKIRKQMHGAALVS